MNSLSSVKSTLLWLLIPVMLMIMVASLLISAEEFKQHANHAFDRTLAGALRSIEVNIRTESGGLSMEQPFYLLEFLELATQGSVYFRIATDDGLTEVGYPRIPMPEQELSNTPVFYNAEYFGGSVRVAAVAVLPKQSLHYNPEARIIIQVAETMQARDDFISQILWQSLRKDALVLGLFFILIYAGVLYAVRPLNTLSGHIKNRRVNDLRPIHAQDLPQEVAPLVLAINNHMERYALKSRQQQQFLDDTSHQLRTPLAVLITQVDYAKTIAKTQEMREVLSAMKQRLGNTVDLTNQLLALAKVQDAAEELSQRQRHEEFDLTIVCAEVVSTLLPVARRKRIDYGMEIPEHPVMVKGVAWLIREALSNLISNAIKYSPIQAQITVSIQETQQYIILQVEDNGPGMSEADIALAGKRFRRGSAGQAQHGTGLGLAIVQTIAEINHCEFLIQSRQPDAGLQVSLRFTHPHRHSSLS